MFETHSIRHESPHLFTKSDVLSGRAALHYPYLVIETKGEYGDPSVPIVHITQIRDVRELLAFPDEVSVIWLWPGKTRSDYFVFEVGDFRAHRELIARTGAGAPVDDPPPGAML